MTNSLLYDSIDSFEGIMVSGISKKNELKLIGIARVSLEKLLLDYNENIKELTAKILGGINS